MYWKKFSACLNFQEIFFMELEIFGVIESGKDQLPFAQKVDNSHYRRYSLGLDS
jgi:hypothetical protein